MPRGWVQWWGFEVSSDVNQVLPLCVQVESQRSEHETNTSITGQRAGVPARSFCLWSRTSVRAVGRWHRPRLCTVIPRSSGMVDLLYIARMFEKCYNLLKELSESDCDSHRRLFAGSGSLFDSPLLALIEVTVETVATETQSNSTENMHPSERRHRST